MRITDYAPPGTERIAMGGDAWVVVRGLTEGEQLAILDTEDPNARAAALFGAIVEVGNVLDASDAPMDVAAFRAYLMASETAAMGGLASAIADRIRARSRLGPGQGG